MIIQQPFVIPAVVIGILSVPLMLSLLPRNRYWGFRTRKTLADDKIWYPVNRLGGCLLLLASLTYLALSFFHPMNGPHDPRFSLWLIHLALFALPLLISIVVTLWYARRI